MKVVYKVDSSVIDEDGNVESMPTTRFNRVTSAMALSMAYYYKGHHSVNLLEYDEINGEGTVLFHCCAEDVSGMLAKVIAPKPRMELKYR